MGEFILDWYHFNIATLLLDIGVTAFSLLALFITLAERAKLKEEQRQFQARQLGKKI